MSTLTSAQLHIKRSSTRLHAPPGGVSSLSFGCGGLGTAEPAEEAPVKDDHSYSRPVSSGRYATPTINNNANTHGGAYPNYNSQPPHQPYQQANAQHQYQHQVPYNANPQTSYSYGNNNFSDNNYGGNNGRPPSSTSYRSSTPSSCSSWGSQPPLTSSKRDQNWEKKRRLWLARKNSSNGSSYGDRPSSTSSWSSGPAVRMLDNNINPPSPLSKFMQQQEQQQQPPPPTPGVDYQRMGTASSSRNSFTSNYMNQQQQGYSTSTQMAGAGYPAGCASFSRSGLSSASSTASSSASSRRQPPGGQCQWSLG
ncbi:hypothetical protein DVH05_017314 [Phytophthora capsici]|nr:hypothetical protein DVH05_017314 [Phytophthora capsici]|eukprot:jgi/Phyca11/105866/e_gw1.11.826.1